MNARAIPGEAAAGAAASLKTQRENLFGRALAGDLDGLPERLAALADACFTERLGEIAVETSGLPPLAIVAVGGYGRRELCPHSDLDVLILFEGKVPAKAQGVSKALFHPLWDIGLDLGHGVRGIKDCLNLAREDMQVLASLLDARFIAGDPGVFDAFLSAFAAKCAGKAREFARWLHSQNVEREQRFGDGSGLLEPDLKSGLGGLRGAHQIRWLEKALALRGEELNLFDPSEAAQLHAAYRFVLRSRSVLHLVSGRHTDTLYFDLQPKVAEVMGFASERAALAVEAFLARLHAEMGCIRSMRDGYWRQCNAVLNGGQWRELTGGLRLGPAGIALRSKNALAADPALLLDVFAQAAECGVPLAWETLREARRAVAPLAAGLRDHPAVMMKLLDILLADRRASGEAGQTMAEIGLLAALIPEFGQARDLVQFDDYHVHPVGRHTLACVRILARLLRPEPGEDVVPGCPWCAEVAERVGDPRTLALAALFHDLGKGREGDHAQVGARLLRQVAARCGMDADMAENAAFLVERHLLLPVTATRSDLSDESVAARVAAAVGSAERLDMLALLSVADSLATGPRAWNTWTGALLAELYFKTRKLLTQGPLAEPLVAQRILEARDKVRALAAGTLEAEFVDRCLDAMPARAFLAMPAETLLRHLEMAGRYEEAMEQDLRDKPSRIAGLGVVLVEVAPCGAHGFVEMTMAAKDRPGLFATLAGTLSLHGFDVQSAELFTWKNGMALDVLIVNEPADRHFRAEAYARVRRSAMYALTGKLSLEYRLEERRRSPLARAKPRPKAASVAIDNRESDFYTRIEVKTADRVGLLYDLAACLHRMGLDIQLARIGSSGGRVADVFYVRDALGRKVEDEAQLREIRLALTHAARG